jgi:hypothetical protein
VTLHVADSTWRRRLPDKAIVQFDNSGRHAQTTNSLGWITHFYYDSGIAGTPLDSIRLPVASGTPPAYRFAYDVTVPSAPVLQSDLPPVI